MAGTVFPKDFTCDSELHDKYAVAHEQYIPYIKHKSKRIGGFAHVDYDDMVQEGRIALLNAVIKHDEKRGPLGPFVNRVLDNAYNAVLYDAITSTRMPRVFAKVDGAWVKVPAAPLSLDTVVIFGSGINASVTTDAGGSANSDDISKDIPDKEPSPAQLYESKEVEAAVLACRMKMMNILKGRDKQIFMCKINPPMELLIMVRNLGGDDDKISNIQIAKYLNINKNVIDHSINNIKTLFTQISRSEFSEYFKDTILESKRMLYISEKARHDVEYIRRIIRQGRLDPKPLKGCHREPDYYQRYGDSMRLVERYPWGCVVVLKRGKSWRTIIIKGRFNSLQGVVFGTNGTREMLPVSWYKQLIKDLRGCDPVRKRSSTMSKDKKLPPCVGMYLEDDSVCNGESDAKDAKDRAPCAWRIRCAALRNHCENTEEELEDYIEIQIDDTSGAQYAVAHDHDRLIDTTEKLVKKDNLVVIDNVVVQAPEDYAEDEGSAIDKPSKKAKSKHKKSKKKKSAPVKPKELKAMSKVADGKRIYPERLQELYEYFKQRLEDSIEGHRFSDPKHAAAPGQLYEKNRTLRSNYIGIYCRTRAGHDVGLALVAFKPRTGRVDIEIPIEYTQCKRFVSRKAFANLEIGAIDDGQFKTIAYGLDNEMADEMCKAIGKAVEEGYIELPEPV